MAEPAGELDLLVEVVDQPGAVATVRPPVGCQSQSMPYRSIVAAIPAKFSVANSSMRAISDGNRATPLSSPWVSDDEQKPPLRPDACSETRPASTTTTVREGSSSLA